MTGIEICLLVAGIVLFAASFMVGNKSKANETTTLSYELSEQDKERLRTQIDVLVKAQIDKIVDEQREAICEQTEAQLDKISNIKTLELNEYAQTVIKEINKNHNEVVFLYDMLNEKAKEVKNTVKDVNIAKDQVIRMETSLDKNLLNKENSVDLVSNESASNTAMSEPQNSKQHLKQNVGQDLVDSDSNTEALMDEMLAHMIESEKPKECLEDSTLDTPSDKNEKILSLYETGMTNKDIAKTLGLGIGEVKLVVGLYKGLKQQ